MNRTLDPSVLTAGDYVSWDLRDGSVTVQVTSVDRFCITYRCRDDVWESVEANVYRTLAEQIARWRPATEEEIAVFQARFRPAPQNWE